jgi:AcrR family transcriptional regulator
VARVALQEQEIDAFRERTAEVATQLFAERGYAAVSLRNIAQELGSSAMTPYRYFENKADIFAAVRERAYRRFIEAQEAAFAVTDDPLGRLLNLRNAYYDFALCEPHSYRVMFQLDQEAPEDYPELLAESDRGFGFLRRAVEGATEAGYFDGDSLTIAHMLWAHVHGLITLHLAGKLSCGMSFEALRDAPLPTLRFPSNLPTNRSATVGKDTEK